MPDPPQSVGTLRSGTDIVLSFTSAVDNGGMPVTGYEVYWEESDGVTFTKTSFCNLEASTDTTCSVDYNVFMDPPFDL